MVRYRWSLVLGVLAAGGVAWIFLGEENVLTTDEANERKQNVFASFEEDEVDRVELRGGGRELVLEKRGDDWKMLRPVAAAADSGAVGSLLSAIDFLTKERTVSGGRSKGELGLKSPRIRGSFRQAGRTTKFLVGAEDAAGESVYVAVGEGPDAFVVGKEFFESLSKDAAEFRDKKVSDVRMADVQKIRVTGGAAPLVVSRSAGAWQMESPTKAVASTTKVEDLLRNVENLRAERFVADDVDDVARFGLQPAWRTISLSRQRGGAVEIRVGSPCEGHEGERHLTRVGSKTVVCAKGDLLTALEDAPESFREKRLVSARAEDVRRISIASGNARVEIERDGERWKVRRPDEGPADKDAVESFVESLRRAEAAEFLPAEDLARRGLQPARTMLVLTMDVDDTEVRVSIGARDGDHVWARRGDEPAVLRVPASVLDSMAPSSLRFRPRQLLNDDSLDARSLRIEAGGADAVSQELEKDEGVWKLTSPSTTRADSLATRDLLRRIGELTVERFDADRPEPRHGLSAPRLTIHARFERDEGEDAPEPEEDGDAGPSDVPSRPTERVREYTLLVGARADGGYFAQLRGKDTVFVIPEALVDDASRPLVDRNGLQLDEGSASRLRLERPGKAPLSLVRDGDAWRREGAGTVDPAKIRDLFDKLSGARAIRAEGFGAGLPAQGLGAPRARLVVTRDTPPEGEPGTVTILIGAKTGEGADEGAFARRDDVASTLVIPKDVADAIVELAL